MNFYPIFQKLSLKLFCLSIFHIF